MLAARVKTDSTVRTAAAQEKFFQNRDLFIEFVMDGQIEVDEEGWPTVNTQAEFLSKLTWTKRPQGVDKCAMDKCGNDIVARNFAWVASVTGKSQGVLKKLDDADWEAVWLVHDLFLPDRT